MMAVIFLASNTPARDLPSFGLLDVVAKKGGHVVGYAVLGLAYLHAILPRGLADPRLARVAVLLAALYAVSDEIHQVFVPGRGASVRDVLIDTVGASLGVGLRLFRQGRRASAQSAPFA
jgi:VanZ family protein